ncbi:hypothetical protein H920_04051 [Fukomys damarensis]|uniref:Uncharacterized protein n=1 Tax=Fukomys damarensis TaxID=885580 RepID=A0A091DQX8_FUKDA|nr:hypothetical protein H920_04051 [Fukomys damarensis]
MAAVVTGVYLPAAYDSQCELRRLLQKTNKAVCGKLGIFKCSSLQVLVTENIQNAGSQAALISKALPCDAQRGLSSAAAVPSSCCLRKKVRKGQVECTDLSPLLLGWLWKTVCVERRLLGYVPVFLILKVGNNMGTHKMHPWKLGKR